jgi:hypothetical protein
MEREKVPLKYSGVLRSVIAHGFLERIVQIIPNEKVPNSDRGSIWGRIAWSLARLRKQT